MSTNEEVGGFLFLAFLMLVLGLFVGGCAMHNCWKEDALKKGFMQFNVKTGNLEWKVERGDE